MIHVEGSNDHLADVFQSSILHKLCGKQVQFRLPLLFLRNLIILKRGNAGEFQTWILYYQRCAFDCNSKPSVVFPFFLSFLQNYETSRIKILQIP